MTTFLYILWFLIPTFFFLTALWTQLERLSGKEAKPTGGDAFRQGVFVLVCVGVCVAIDQYILGDLVTSFAPDFLPLGFFQAILLPIVLYVAAMMFGGSKEILISRAPKPSQAKRKK